MEVELMSEGDWVYCDAYGTNVTIFECKNAKYKNGKMVSSYEECPIMGIF